MFRKIGIILVIFTIYLSYCNLQSKMEIKEEIKCK